MDAQKWDTVRVWIARAVGVILLAALLAVTWRVVQIRAEAQSLAELDRNMRAMGLALTAHAAGSDGGRYAPLSREPGTLFFQAAGLFPIMLEDPTVVVSPRRNGARSLIRQLEDAARPDGTHDPATIERAGAESFYYLGFAVYDSATAQAFVDAYRASFAETGGAPGGDTLHPPPDAPDAFPALHRLRDGVERMLGPNQPTGPALVTPAQATIPILIERPPADGAPIRVLFMDGHRANVPPGVFPNLPEVIAGLESLRSP